MLPRALKLMAGLLLCSGTILTTTYPVAASQPVPGSKVDGRQIVANSKSTREWPTIGLDYAETRFSRLSSIDSSNVKRLGLAWSYDLESDKGVEATPLVVDGVMYVTASWSVVHAIDARTGKKLWVFDPEVPRSTYAKGCCDAVNRGLAIWKGKVFVASFDGRLIALDSATGKKAWEQDTIIDRSRSYTSTGAPRVFKGNVVIGNAGAEFGVRGYITAYDAETGAQKWRWFTVPGDPSKPFEDESMARAAKTWDPSGKYWEAGGGGTAWDSMAFDPDLNLMYVGTGNGSPWAHRHRSPAGGDNLYLSSIVALNPDTGKYVWHYQETPGDNWDYTATQPMILADLKIAGKKRKVILHAPKNGFFFVVDRTNGKFISAKNFAPVNWATGYDKSGRPIEVPEARDPNKAVEPVPGPVGAHSWHSMSFNPQTGLAYFPAQNIPFTLKEAKSWMLNKHEAGVFMSNTGWNLGHLVNAEPPKGNIWGALIAWDPVKQVEVWRQPHLFPINGGTLTTAGNLVFQGSGDGRFFAFDARSGSKLWEVDVGGGVLAAAGTYELDGKQYVSLAVGWGGNIGQLTGVAKYQNRGKVFTFALDGTAPMPKFEPYTTAPLLSGVKYDRSLVDAGAGLYVSSCAMCHGTPGVDRGGANPNLGYVAPAVIENLEAWVLGGAAKQRGMPDFTGRLTQSDVEKLKAFIQHTAEGAKKP